MDKILLSIIHQKAMGTYERNQDIRKLAKEGLNYARIGRRYKITRQAARDIVNQPGE